MIEKSLQFWDLSFYIHFILPQKCIPVPQGTEYISYAVLYLIPWSQLYHCLE